MSPEFAVYIVDDDPSVRDALGLMLGFKGYKTAVFASGEDFLSAWREDWTGCLLIDIRMPGIDGLALQQRLNGLNCQLPVVIVTGHGDVTQAREAFKADACDFLEKPLDSAKLVDAIEGAFSQQEKRREVKRHREIAAKVLNELTPREREVMALVVKGKHNREIAPALGISVRTVEVHKTRLMAKLGVDNMADLVRVSMLASRD